MMASRPTLVNWRLLWVRICTALPCSAISTKANPGGDRKQLAAQALEALAIQQGFVDHGIGHGLSALRPHFVDGAREVQHQRQWAQRLAYHVAHFAPPRQHQHVAAGQRVRVQRGRHGFLEVGGARGLGTRCQGLGEFDLQFGLTRRVVANEHQPQHGRRLLQQAPGHGVDLWRLCVGHGHEPAVDRVGLQVPEPEGQNGMRRSRFHFQLEVDARDGVLKGPAQYRLQQRKQQCGVAYQQRAGKLLLHVNAAGMDFAAALTQRFAQERGEVQAFTRRLHVAMFRPHHLLAHDAGATPEVGFGMQCRQVVAVDAAGGVEHRHPFQRRRQRRGNLAAEPGHGGLQVQRFDDTSTRRPDGARGRAMSIRSTADLFLKRRFATRAWG